MDNSKSRSTLSCSNKKRGHDNVRLNASSKEFVPTNNEWKRGNGDRVFQWTREPNCGARSSSLEPSPRLKLKSKTFMFQRGKQLLTSFTSSVNGISNSGEKTAAPDQTVDPGFSSLRVNIDTVPSVQVDARIKGIEDLKPNTLNPNKVYTPMSPRHRRASSRAQGFRATYKHSRNKSAPPVGIDAQNSKALKVQYLQAQCQRNVRARPMLKAKLKSMRRKEMLMERSQLQSPSMSQKKKERIRQRIEKTTIKRRHRRSLSARASMSSMTSTMSNLASLV
mmetsp:Transcript_2453/g.3585  ORF Transcript_2453/g.3585 Transcript_2453/m.3585 type:complete len:279 (-) Transcript_2453:346-1182(-)|eukprot:CAMPEP_0184480380 /NCGR_PEP_ID=MMETSP0113_2-20130426/1882_1 /TAXON_ID=91329 /ORGANISM="Norrisiella sphaerica, Strain BC52" /LENGTH=278 /DNA_ID=CAMNT_0026858823 /DNA_START=355 /DNA_END=1191 /DNA_ORIENTATION=-